MSQQTMKSRQTYLDNIRAKTGKTAEELGAMAKAKGLTKSSQVVAWLKREFDLGYGHAGMIWYLMAYADDAKTTHTDRLAKLFAGKKDKWYKPYQDLEARIKKFGADVNISANITYINMLRDEKKFAIVQPSSERLDIGVKLKGTKIEAKAGRLEPSGSWNVMVTHRLKISDAKEVNKEVLAYLKQAYDLAITKKVTL
jgi:predicted transport protein